MTWIDHAQPERYEKTILERNIDTIGQIQFGKKKW